MHTLHKSRATLYFLQDCVLKTYEDVSRAEFEADWYRQLPDGVPPMLIDCDPVNGVLVMERLGSVPSKPSAYTIDALREMLRMLEEMGIHHRDVHPGNIVVDGAGNPRLIDWETAIRVEGAPSYDIYGPSDAVPIPAIHKDLNGRYQMHWHSSDAASLKNSWGVDYVPA